MNNKNIFFTKRVEMMMIDLSKEKSCLKPSAYWSYLNSFHKNLIKEGGYENFKRMLGKYYFANTPWFLMNKQILFLITHLSLITVLKCLLKSFLIGKHDFYTYIDSISYNFITLLIWEFTLRIDNDNFLEKFEEPLVGNPPKIYFKGKLISQDIANSVLEYKSIIGGIGKDNIESIKTICEIGAGSGRDVFVINKLLKGLKKYIVVDVPPALAICEQYITDVFPNKKIFKYRKFDSFEDIEEEFKNSDILFFLPTQIEKLPNNIIDLFINISSFHEMSKIQINKYFSEIERLSKKPGWLYFKEWKKSINHIDKIEVGFNDYPVRKKWKNIYTRTPFVQIKFFEALYKL